MLIYHSRDGPHGKPVSTGKYMASSKRRKMGNFIEFMNVSPLILRRWKFGRKIVINIVFNATYMSLLKEYDLNNVELWLYYPRECKYVHIYL